MVCDKSLYNEDELNAPEWLNEEFFAEVLSKNEEGKEVQIKELTITPGTTKADHYASIMFRAKIDYTVFEPHGLTECKHQSLIIKTMPVEEGQKMDVLGDMDVFQTEIRMYTETLPQMEAILRKYGDHTTLCAKLFYHSLKPRKCVIFEDLVEKGYAAISNRYCSIDEVKMAFLKLAKIHAVSYKLAQEGDKNITRYNRGSFTCINFEEFNLTKYAVQIFNEVLAENDDLKAYIPHFEHFGKVFFNQIKSSLEAYELGERSGIYALNHGDFHMKNMMLQNDGGENKDVMLVDFQISHFGSIAIDILYSFNMMMSPNMRRNNKDELYYFYFSNFQKNLKLIEYEGHIPTMTEFQTELIKYKHWEIFLVLTLLMLSYVFPDKDGDLAKVIEDENYRKEVLRNKGFLQELRELLPQYLHKGYFEE